MGTALIQTADGSLVGDSTALDGAQCKVTILEALTPEQETDEMSMDECVEFMQKLPPDEVKNVLGQDAYTVGRAKSVTVNLPTPPPVAIAGMPPGNTPAPSGAVPTGPTSDVIEAESIEPTPAPAPAGVVRAPLLSVMAIVAAKLLF